MAPRPRQLTVYPSGNEVFDRWQRDVIAVLNPFLQWAAGVTIISVTSPITNTGTSTAPNIGMVSPLPVGNGGTGATALAGYGAVVMNAGGTAQTTVAPSTSGNVLTSNGTAWTSAAPAASGLTQPQVLRMISFGGF